MGKKINPPIDETVPDSDAELASPHKIPGYEIGQMLGQDLMGVVYLAKRKKDQADVALKVMSAELADNELARNMFAREIKVMSGLGHDNVVALYDHGSVGTTAYFVMEYCPGGNLMDLMKRRGGKLSLDEAGPLAIQALEGLCHAHKKGYVHRNIKPANILLSARSAGVAKVGGFGLAKNFEATETSGIRKTGQVGGTLPYMPREQLTNFEYLKPVSDVWSMGATLYVALTGQLPRDFRPGQDPIQVVLRQPAIPIRKRDSDIPESVAEVIDHALQENTKDRYQTAEEFRQALVSCCKPTGREDLSTEQEKTGNGSHQHVGETVPDHSTPAALPDATVLEPDAEPIRSAEDDVESEWEVGDVILDLYRVEGLLGEGGMGKVYRVHHRGWNMDLAMKSPRPEFFATEKQKANFVRECESWIRLGLHPHTVSCHYVRLLGDMPRVFAECVEGGSLLDWVNSGKLYEGGPEATLERVLDVAIQLAWGLNYAHEQKLIHQDIKPANVLLTPEGVAKVTDFGLGMTPAYCSPEQKGGRDLSRKTDIWSWAVSLLEMFTGERTWRGGELAGENLQGYMEAETGQEFRCYMPEAVAELLQECFRLDPAERPGGMGEVAARLLEVYRQFTGAVYPRTEPKATKLLADSLNNKALSFLDLERHEDAVSAWNDALSADPQHAEATFNLGLWRWRRGEQTDEELVRQLEEVCATQSGAGRPWYLMALVHLERGDNRGSAEALHQATRLMGETDEMTHAFAQLRDAGGEACRDRTFSGHKGEIRDVVVAPGGERAASADTEGVIYVWSLLDGSCEYRLTEHEQHEPDSVQIAGVACLTITPDGRLLVSGGNDGTICAWTLESGDMLDAVPAHGGKWVNCLAISGNGHRLVSGGAGGSTTVEVRDLESGRLLRKLKGHGSPIDCVAVTYDGRRAVSSSSSTPDISARLWNLDKGKQIAHWEGTRPVAVTPDGRWAVTQGVSMFTMQPIGQSIQQENARLVLWEMSRGRQVEVTERLTGSVTAIAISEDGRTLLSGDWSGSVRLWDLPTLAPGRTLHGHQRPVRSVLIAPDGRTAVTGGDDATVRLWSLPDGRCLRTFGVADGALFPWAITPDGRRLLTSATAQSLQLVSLDGIGLKRSAWALCRPAGSLQALQAASRVRDALADARSAITGGDFRRAGDAVRRALETPGFERDAESLDLWHRLGCVAGERAGLRDVQCVRTIEGAYSSIFLNNPLLLVPGSPRVLAPRGFGDAEFGLWDIEDGSLIHEMKGHNEGFPAHGWTVSGDGSLALSGGADKTVRVWDLTSGEGLAVLSDGETPLFSVAFALDNRYVLAGGMEGTLFVWDWQKGECEFQIEAHESQIQSILVFGDGRYAITVGHDGKLCLWNLRTRECEHKFEGIYPAALTSDEREIVTRHPDGGLAVHSLSGSPHERVGLGDDGGMSLVVTTPDGRQAVSASRDGTLRLWRLSDAVCMRVMTGHKEAIKSLAVSADGRFAASGGRDWKIRIWDLQGGKCVRVLPGHDGEITGLVLLPDERGLVSLGGRGQLKLWRFDWEWDFTTS